MDFLGGYGLGSYLLYQRQPAKADALGPESIFGLTTGPLTGTQAITGNRFTAVGQSPKTLTWGDANCGGNFGPGLKFAGVDGVFLKGISSKPARKKASRWTTRPKPASISMPWAGMRKTHRPKLKLCGSSVWTR